jgi:hypothetical protein
MQYPVLFAFLGIVRTTSILELRYRSPGEKREMRWTRASREEDFEAECWTLE